MNDYSDTHPRQWESSDPAIQEWMQTEWRKIPAVDDGDPLTRRKRRYLWYLGMLTLFDDGGGDDEIWKSVP